MTHDSAACWTYKDWIKKGIITDVKLSKRSSIVKYLFNLHLNISYVHYEIFT